jgi:hypothetical protein
VHAAQPARREGGDGRVPRASPSARLLTSPASSLAMLAHATRSDGHVPVPGSPSALAAEPKSEAGAIGEGAGGASLAVSFIRYLDVILVVASTPFVLLASLPAAGFGIGAGAWIVARFGVSFVERRAWSARDFRVRAALHLAAILGRVWLIGLAVLLARFTVGTPNGIAAAVVVLAAFTVELVMKVMLRRSITATLRRPS